MKKIILKNKLVYIFFFYIIFSYFISNNVNLSPETKILNSINWIVSFLFFTSFIFYCIKNNKNPIEFLVYSFVFILFLNLILFSLNVSRSELSLVLGDAILLKNIFAISINRVSFFFGPESPNHMAIFIAMYSPLVFVLKNKSLRYFVLIGILLSLLLIDSRMSIVALFFSILLYFPFKKLKLNFVTKVVIVLTPLFVAILLGVLPLIQSMTSFDLISRDSEDITTANSRTLIWTSVIDNIATLNFNTIFGAGEYGNLTYSSSADYLYLFDNYANAVKSVHNTYLQMILDKGYVFLILFYALLLSLANTLIKNKDDVNIQIYTVTIIVFLISGTTEVIIGSYYFTIIFTILMLHMYINAKYNNLVIQNENKNTRNKL
ncbi:O-antigen ligase family protein [Flavobacterium sp.]|uniref:O-antigen ligase family protein n=1 Tax=Flavobacterium sp. TaxID=239 RepID=UPI00286E6A46|nr:O-antigen ligase family protein [Flavobacterium sp.]